jgi:hypothetical protein
LTAAAAAAAQVARASDLKRGLNDNSDKSSARYMASVLLDERRWAFFYRRGRFTLGIASTQRCESFFSKLKGALGRISSLRHLTGVLASIMEADALETVIVHNLLKTRFTTADHLELRNVSALGVDARAHTFMSMHARTRS